jgi:hypothetical protein
MMFLALFTHLTTAAFAQKIEVVPANEMIDGQSLAGLKTVLALDEKKVKDGWRDQLKTYGKVEVPKGSKIQMEVKLANIPQITSLPLSITSTVSTLQGATTIFYAMRLDADYVTDPKHPDFAKSKAILRDFAVKMYQESITKEVSDAQHALDKQTREQTQTIREGENLTKSVEKNKQDKLKLQQEVAKNREDSVSLVKAVAVNKEEYQQALTAWESQNKLMDEMKNKSSEEVSADKKKEEQKKFDFLTKQKQSRSSEGNRLVQSQEKNEREKQNLFNKLQKNATELDHLMLSIEHNKKKQAQDIVQVDQRKKELEAVKNRLATIK